MWVWWVRAACILGGLSVVFGSFGAHALKRTLSVERLDVFEVAVRYQAYGALSLFGVAFVATRVASSLASWAGFLFVLGTIIFSGSLYLVAVFNMRRFGVVTPVGGVFLIAAWVLLGLSVSIK